MKYLMSAADFQSLLADVYVDPCRGRVPVKSREKETFGKVLFKESAAVVADVTFVVSAKGYDSFLRKKKRTNHAFVRGVVCDVLPEVSPDMLAGWADRGALTVVYNPFNGPDFVTREVTPRKVISAQKVLVLPKFCLVQNPMFA